MKLNCLFNILISYNFGTVFVNSINLRVSVPMFKYSWINENNHFCENNGQNFDDHNLIAQPIDSIVGKEMDTMKVDLMHLGMGHPNMPENGEENGNPIGQHGYFN